MLTVLQVAEEGQVATAFLEAVQLAVVPEFCPEQVQVVGVPVNGKTGEVGLAVPTEQKVSEP